MNSIGILGGTFDPVHHGHLRLAVEVLEALELAEVRLIPTHSPPHREGPEVPGLMRLAMLELAVRDEPSLKVDDREIRREGVSYTVDTLGHLREELGRDLPLCLIMGMDAFNGLPGWHRWRELEELAHIVIAHRPGAALPQDPELRALLDRRGITDANLLHKRPAGCVLLLSLPMLEISATQIRDLIAAGRNPRFLMPDPVYALIRKHHFYTSPRQSDAG